VIKLKYKNKMITEQSQTIKQPEYHIRPISVIDAFTFRTYLRRRDEDSVAEVINYLENKRIAPYLFGSVLDMTKKYKDVDVIGVAESRKDFSESFALFTVGTREPITIGGNLFDVRLNEEYPNFLTEGSFVITPVQTRLGRRFRRIAGIDVSLMTGENFRALVKSHLAVYEDTIKK
jgi:hypothetical protein